MPPAKGRKTTAESRLAAEPETSSRPTDAAGGGIPGDLLLTDAVAADQTTLQENEGHSDEESESEEVQRARTIKQLNDRQAELAALKAQRDILMQQVAAKQRAALDCERVK